MRLLISILMVSYCLWLTHASAQTEQAQIETATNAVSGYADFRAARRAGWVPFGGETLLMGRHYQHRDNIDYVTGDELDFTRPTNLVYSKINGQNQLVALAWVVRKRPDEPLPAGFAGPADIWHVHDGTRFLNAVEESHPFVASLAKRWFQKELAEKDGRTQLAMVHLWLIPNPKGQFASHNPALTYRDHGLPLDWADTDMDVAQGLALAEVNGCRDALEANLWVAGASGPTKRSLRRVCRSLAKQVSDRLTGSEDEIEAFARAAWQRFEDIQFMTLTDKERARIAAFVEDGPGVCR